MAAWRSQGRSPRLMTAAAVIGHGRPVAHRRQPLDELPEFHGRPVVRRRPCGYRRNRGGRRDEIVGSSTVPRTCRRLPVNHHDSAILLRTSSRRRGDMCAAGSHRKRGDYGWSAVLLWAAQSAIRCTDFTMAIQLSRTCAGATRADARCRTNSDNLLRRNCCTFPHVPNRLEFCDHISLPRR
jgi:hypothetical protein